MRFLESLPLLVDLENWETTEHQPRFGWHHHPEALVDLAPIADMRPILQYALFEFSKEKLFSFFPSSLEDGSIPLGDQADRLFLVR